MMMLDCSKNRFDNFATKFCSCSFKNKYEKLLSETLIKSACRLSRYDLLFSIYSFGHKENVVPHEYEWLSKVSSEDKRKANDILWNVPIVDIYKECNDLLLVA